MTTIAQTDRSTTDSSRLAKQPSSGVDAPEPQGRSRLEDYERDDEDKPPYYLTRTEIKLLGITGVRNPNPTIHYTSTDDICFQVGFFLDGAPLSSCMISPYLSLFFSRASLRPLHHQRASHECSRILWLAKCHISICSPLRPCSNTASTVVTPCLPTSKGSSKLVRT